MTVLLGETLVLNFEEESAWFYPLQVHRKLSLLVLQLPALASREALCNTKMDHGVASASMYESGYTYINTFCGQTINPVRFRLFCHWMLSAMVQKGDSLECCSKFRRCNDHIRPRRFAGASRCGWGSCHSLARSGGWFAICVLSFVYGRRCK